MFPFSRAALPVALLALAGLASSASAQTVQDGGFESATSGPANSTAYYTSGSGFDSSWTIVGEVGIDTQDVYVFDGSQSLYLNSGIGTDSITQNIATDPAQFYTVSFFANDDTPGDALNVKFGGITSSVSPVTANGYNGPAPGNDGLFTQYTFSGLKTASAFTALSFSSVGSLSSGDLEIDDISVTSSPVPEASTSLSLGLLLVLGLGGAAWTAKKRSEVKTASVSA